jgi:hypothetical protein
MGNRLPVSSCVDATESITQMGGVQAKELRFTAKGADAVLDYLSAIE